MISIHLIAEWILAGSDARCDWGRRLAPGAPKRPTHAERERFLRDLDRVHLQWFAAEDEGRTEDPTEHKVRKAREEGKVAKSQDVTSALLLLFTIVTIALLSDYLLNHMLTMVGWFVHNATLIDITEPNDVVSTFYGYFIRIMIPIAAVALVTAIMGNLVQVGPLFTLKAISPDFNKITPKVGKFIERSFLSTEALFNWFKNLGKVIILSGLAFLIIQGNIHRITNLLRVPFLQAFGEIARLAFSLLVYAGIILLVLSIFDYMFQRHLHRESLKMTRQEVKEERKTYEGDPMVKSRMKQRMQELLSRNMVQNVPEADVVVTNPTHYAVAMQYRRELMEAPTVIAKGADQIAFRIREVAEESEVPLIENKPLARALYAEVEIGDVIPEKFYEAVVAVLINVYRLKGPWFGLAVSRMSYFQSILGSAFGKQRTDILVAVGVIIVVMMLIIPLPAVLLDTLMSLNLVLSLLTILIVLYIRSALEFSVFPTLLLVLTVYGLALNVSSTRLILSQGSAFDGQIVRAFSDFVVGTGGLEGLVIGIIIFVIIIAVQFIVITKGATRVAEVAARFTLDSLPGKQMAIEAEYNSGSITEEEATKRKMDLEREVDFYGAMDGASKFVQGNVRVGVLITVVNIVGGIVVGMTIHNESFDMAMNTYIALAIGDGLVTQFPALLISTATGLIVTRAISDGTFGEDLTTQFTNQTRIYWIAAFFLLGLSILPGFPWYVLIPLALLSAALAFTLGRRQAVTAQKEQAEAAQPQEQERPVELSPVAPLDPLSLELGYGLVPLVDKEKGAELLDRVTRIRREAALDLGLVVPRIRIIDNMRLEPSAYAFKIRGVEIGSGTIKMGQYLCINPGGEREDIPGERTTDPAFGLPALWITEEYRDRAERAGYTVVDPPSIIATHLTEIIKKYAADILGRQEVKSMLDTLKKDYPAVVEDVQGVLSVGEVQKVLQGLLREQVSIRNMVQILETLADYGSVTKDVGFLVEKARQALRRQISLQHADEEKTLRVLTIDPKLEQRIVESRVETAGGVVPALPPDVQREWINAVSNSLRQAREQGLYPVLLCSEAARPLVKQSTVRDIPDIVVLSVPEIISEVNVESIGEIKISEQG